jgi:hypothetical protein
MLLRVSTDSPPLARTDGPDAHGNGVRPSPGRHGYDPSVVRGERDAVPGMWINSRQGTTGAHRAGLPPISLLMWEAVQRAQHRIPDDLGGEAVPVVGIRWRLHAASLAGLRECGHTWLP